MEEGSKTYFLLSRKSWETYEVVCDASSGPSSVKSRIHTTTEEKEEEDELQNIDNERHTETMESDTPCFGYLLHLPKTWEYHDDMSDISSYSSLHVQQQFICKYCKETFTQKHHLAKHLFYQLVKQELVLLWFVYL